jgi:aminopeptidase-like protein
VNVSELARQARSSDAGTSMYDLMAGLFPLCRSITGAGLRATLDRIGQLVPLQLSEVPTGTRAFDWTVPKEWNIRDAWVANENGERVIDYRTSNLHVLNYSTPVRRRLTLDELRPHLHTLPDHPTWVPYRTSYYAETWGFCLSQEALDRLPDGEYEAVIDTTLEDGSLTYGECVLPGETEDEILVSSHVCHPSLANDNLSGVVVAAYLASLLAEVDRRYTYRFVFAPGTIGAIVWLARNDNAIDRVRAGLVLACVGDGGPVVYKRSRRGDTEVDRAAAHVLHGRRRGDEVIAFSPYGNDERQFCSPGFDLPVGAITRSGHDRSVRHHTSADDLASIDPAALSDTVDVCLAVLGVLEDNATLVSLNPKGEPQLGRRGLYRSFGGRAEQAALESALLWAMSLADGEHTTLDVAERAGLPFAVVAEAASALAQAKLLRRETAQRTTKGSDDESGAVLWWAGDAPT